MNNTDTQKVAGNTHNSEPSGANKERYLTTESAKELTEFEKKYNIWVGMVYAWDKQAIAGKDEKAVAAMIADIAHNEEGIAKVFAVRVLSQTENGVEHVSMTAPIFFEGGQRKIEDLLGQYTDAYLEEVYDSPVLAGKENVPVVFEFIPVRGYKIGNYIHELSNEKETGLKIKDRMLAVKHYEAMADGQDTEFSQALVSLASKSDEDLFDPRHPTQVFHISELIKSSEGKRVRLTDEIVIRTPLEVEEIANYANKSPTTLNPEQFAKKMEDLVERVEALERRARFSK